MERAGHQPGVAGVRGVYGRNTVPVYQDFKWGLKTRQGNLTV
jgi:hypothetical protein